MPLCQYSSQGRQNPRISLLLKIPCPVSWDCLYDESSCLWLCYITGQRDFAGVIKITNWLTLSYPKKCYPGRPNLSHKSFKSGKFSLAGGRTIQSIRFEELLLAFKMERTTHKGQKRAASELRTTPGQQPARKRGLQSYNHMEPNSTNNLDEPGADSSPDTRDKMLASQKTLTLALRPYTEHLVEPTSSDLQTVSW